MDARWNLEWRRELWARSLRIYYVLLKPPSIMPQSGVSWVTFVQLWLLALQRGVTSCCLLHIFQEGFWIEDGLQGFFAPLVIASFPGRVSCITRRDEAIAQLITRGGGGGEWSNGNTVGGKGGLVTTECRCCPWFFTRHGIHNFLSFVSLTPKQVVTVDTRSLPKRPRGPSAPTAIEPVPSAKDACGVPPAETAWNALRQWQSRLSTMFSGT